MVELGILYFDVATWNEDSPIPNIIEETINLGLTTVSYGARSGRAAGDVDSGWRAARGSALRWRLE